MENAAVTRTTFTHVFIRWVSHSVKMKVASALHCAEISKMFAEYY